MRKASYDSKRICLDFSICKGRVQLYLKGCLDLDLKYVADSNL